MSWFVYVIECEDGSLYTGVAVDPHMRYAAHCVGEGARYTRSHPPRKLLLILEFPDRSSALKEEYRVKQLSAAEKRRFLLPWLFPGVGVDRPPAPRSIP